MPDSSRPPHRRKHIQVRGIVQGVGFRPFVYKLANSLRLTGYVFNSSSGVTIEVEGGESQVDEFLTTLRNDPPQLAEITQIKVSEIAVQGDTGFSILGSREEAGEFVLISPDAGTCDACWRDFGDPSNRRYGYPFTNCTHCGPRYTIIRDIPYDRATGQSTRIPKTAAFMPSLMPALSAGPRCCWSRVY
jgi:hydrogenase maturation protein HypF